MSFSWSTVERDSPGTQGGKRTKMSHPITSWDINDSLAADFDGSLSGLGTELGTGTYNMSEALLALPVFKQENLDNGFQYILGAATSPAVKINEETLTYLNQGQSYEIKLKKLGDLSDMQGKCLRSVVKVCFHERRLQYMEKEQLESWKQIRPGERIMDIDIPLSYGLMEVNLDSIDGGHSAGGLMDPSQNTARLNGAEVVWDPTKEAGVYIRVNCISTEFTAKKHGGEKGVPFRVQVETYAKGDDNKLLHCASCQVKVFKPKGADRKHKRDREKMEKMSEIEKEKFQPSYECTVLTEVPVEQVLASTATIGVKSPSTFSSLAQSFSELSATRSPSVTVIGHSPLRTAGPSSVTSTPNHTGDNSGEGLALISHNRNSSDSPIDTSLSPGALSAEATANQVTAWLQANRFFNYSRVFQNFSGADILRLSREDLIQICGIVDGIRLNNALQDKAVRPRLTIFVCQESDSVYHALYMESLSSHELTCKLAALYSVGPEQIAELYCQGPSEIYILVTDEVVGNLVDQSRFCVEAIKSDTSNQYKVLLKTIP
ncbi:transcription factor CP2-like [Pecten maximus]|uniref:transcription factor CP2-like n=1 Tax=Pecten maximus TaxID=6579 RepID=UPI0014587758|nr:transcription factor CP2-like [Pecten maximus]XP_033733293.1 transcription factor CP2-like [Pecten maximus]